MLLSLLPPPAAACCGCRPAPSAAAPPPPSSSAPPPHPPPSSSTSPPPSSSPASLLLLLLLDRDFGPGSGLDPGFIHGSTNKTSRCSTFSGLNRCGKSCRLRWTNYLRPGIKRGNFTAEEDRMMIRLHDVLGNKWSAIAQYLPGRTDNDVKNYWKSHLKKNATSVPNQDSDSSQRRWERRLQENVHLARKALSDALSPQASIPDHEVLSHSPPGTAPNSDATLPPTAPGLGSPLPVATAPLLSTGFMSFKPPRDWKQNASQQQLIPADNHQFRSQAAAKSSQASNHSPYVFNYENIALWLPRWNKETPVSRLENNSARNLPLPPGAVTVPARPAVPGRQHEASIPPALVPISASPTGQNEDDCLRQLEMFAPYGQVNSAHRPPLPPAAAYVPAPPTILGRQHEDSLPPALVLTSASPTGQNENHSLLQLKLSVPYGQANSARHPPLPPAAVIVPARPAVLGRQHEDSMPPAPVPMSASPTGQNEDDRLRQLKMSVPCGQVNSAHHPPLPPVAVTVPAPPAPPAVPGRQHEDFLPPDREFTSASPTEQNEDDRLPQLIMTVPYDQPTWPFF